MSNPTDNAVLDNFSYSFLRFCGTRLGFLVCYLACWWWTGNFVAAFFVTPILILALGLAAVVVMPIFAVLLAVLFYAVAIIAAPFIGKKS